MITCFDLPERAAEPDELMSVVRERLAPGGLFFAATPDALAGARSGGFTEPAFRALLAGSFRHVTVLRQNIAVGSVLTGDREHGPVLSQQLRRAGTWSAGPGVPHTHLVGIASDEPVEPPAAATLLDPDETLLTAVADGAAEPLRTEIERLASGHDDVRPVRRLIGRYRPHRRATEDRSR